MKHSPIQFNYARVKEIFLFTPLFDVDVHHRVQQFPPQDTSCRCHRHQSPPALWHRHLQTYKKKPAGINLESKPPVETPLATPILGGDKLFVRKGVVNVPDKTTNFFRGLDWSNRSYILLFATVIPKSHSTPLTLFSFDDFECFPLRTPYKLPKSLFFFLLSPFETIPTFPHILEKTRNLRLYVFFWTHSQTQFPTRCFFSPKYQIFFLSPLGGHFIILTPHTVPIVFVPNRTCTK